MAYLGQPCTCVKVFDHHCSSFSHSCYCRQRRKPYCSLCQQVRHNLFTQWLVADRATLQLWPWDCKKRPRCWLYALTTIMKPIPVQNGNIFSIGGDYVPSARLSAPLLLWPLNNNDRRWPLVISKVVLANLLQCSNNYLRTPLLIDSCGLNGEGCTLIETTLVNPMLHHSGSFLTSHFTFSHAFSVISGLG